MKKNILLVMVMMLMTSVSALAQKEYNMVITLNNGTTVTLGHNDIKEITFNDGDVSISGNMVNTIDSLAGVTTVLDNKIMTVAETADENFKNITAIYDENFKNVTAIYDANFDAVKDFIDYQEGTNSELKEMDSTLLDIVDKILDTMSLLHPELADAPEIKNAKTMLAAKRNAATRNAAGRKSINLQHGSIR